MEGEGKSYSDRGGWVGGWDGTLGYGGLILEGRFLQELLVFCREDFFLLLLLLFSFSSSISSSSSFFDKEGLDPAYYRGAFSFLLFLISGCSRLMK